MSLFRVKLRKIATLSTVVLLVTGFVYAPVSPVSAPRPVEATGWPVFDGGNFLQNTMTAISAGASAVADEYLSLKESVLDGIAYTLINAVIEQMIRDTTAWVASGFEGKPAFVEDLGGYLGQVGDSLVGDFIWESDTLAFLCSPFKLDVKIALDLQYGHTRDYQWNAAQCSLSEAVGNLESFMDQGWGNWFEVTMNVDNNPYGAVYKARTALSANLAAARSQETKTLEFGSGFFSQQDEFGRIITPGQTIQTGIANALNVPNERLAMADEINELIGALLTQLVRGVLSEVSGGLRGLGGSGSVFESPDYASSAGSVGAGMSRQFDTDRTREERYLASANEGIGVINTALAGPGCDADMRAELVTHRTSLTAGAAEARAHIATIDEYEASLTSGTLSVVEIQTRVEQYMEDVRPTFHSAQEIAQLEASLAALPSDEDDAYTTLASDGNIRALAALYEQSCD